MYVNPSIANPHPVRLTGTLMFICWALLTLWYPVESDCLLPLCSLTLFIFLFFISPFQPFPCSLYALTGLSSASLTPPLASSVFRLPCLCSSPPSDLHSVQCPFSWQESADFSQLSIVTTEGKKQKQASTCSTGILITWLPAKPQAEWGKSYASAKLVLQHWWWAFRFPLHRSDSAA